MDNAEFTRAGYETPPETLTRNAQDQARLLLCCGVGSAAHGNYWAPGLLGTNCFAHLTASGQDIRGSVHFDMRLIQEEPVSLSESLTIAGRTEAVEPAPKGDMLHLAFDFSRDDGTVPVRCRLGVLMPDPDRMAGPRTAGGPPADDRAGFIKRAERQLVPEDVTGYGGAGNPIHLDPDFAQSLGFRAPIAHGVMTAVWLLGALDRPEAPSKLDAAFVFKRPVFWDDRMELWIEDGEMSGFGRYRALNADGKTTAEMTVANINYL